MLKSGMYDFVICRGGTDMCFVFGFGRKRPDLKQYRISGLTPSHRSCQQGEPSPYLCLASLTKSTTSVILVTLADNDRSPSTPVTSVVPSLSSRRNTSRGYRWVTRLLPLRTAVARDPKAELRSRQQVEPRGLLLDISQLR